MKVEPIPKNWKMYTRLGKLNKIKDCIIDIDYYQSNYSGVHVFK